MASIATVGSLVGKSALGAIGSNAATKVFNKATGFVTKKMSTKPKRKSNKRKSGGKRSRVSVRYPKRRKTSKTRRSHRRRRHY